jgi:hypothetical protein
MDTLLRLKRGKIVVHADDLAVDISDDKNFITFPWGDIDWLIRALTAARKREKKWTSKRSA